MVDMRKLQDFDTSDTEKGHLQKDYILKEGVTVTITLTKDGKTLGEFGKTVPQGKEAKLVLIVQVKDLGNWDLRSANIEVPP